MKLTKNIHRLKVYYTGRYPSYLPQIKFSGEWLKRAGFEIGDRICLTCGDGKLSIEKQY